MLLVVPIGAGLVLFVLALLVLALFAHKRGMWPSTHARNPIHPLTEPEMPAGLTTRVPITTPVPDQPSLPAVYMRNLRLHLAKVAWSEEAPSLPAASAPQPELMLAQDASASAGAELGVDEQHSAGRRVGNKREDAAAEGLALSRSTGTDPGYVLSVPARL